MLHTKFQGHRLIGSREEELLRFYHIWVWRPYWSCDLDHLNILTFPCRMEAPYEIWLQLAQWFHRRRCLKKLARNCQRPAYTMSSPESLGEVNKKKLEMLRFFFRSKKSIRKYKLKHNGHLSLPVFSHYSVQRIFHCQNESNCIHTGVRNISTKFKLSYLHTKFMITLEV